MKETKFINFLSKSISDNSLIQDNDFIIYINM